MLLGPRGEKDSVYHQKEIDADQRGGGERNSVKCLKEQGGRGKESLHHCEKAVWAERSKSEEERASKSRDRREPAPKNSQEVQKSGAEKLSLHSSSVEKILKVRRTLRVNNEGDFLQLHFPQKATMCRCRERYRREDTDDVERDGRGRCFSLEENRERRRRPQSRLQRSADREENRQRGKGATEDGNGSREIKGPVGEWG